jgi:integrase
MSDDAGNPAFGITSDNLHLSEVTPANAVCEKFADSVTCPVGGRSETNADSCTDEAVLRFVEAATAANTRRAYDSDLRHFLSWGGRMPATDRLVARYLADHAGLLAISTLTRRLVSIRSAHVAPGLPDPTKSELVRLTFRGIRRKHGRPQRRVAALGTGDLLAIVRSLGQSAKDVRDAAILLVGFAGAFRRSELAAVDYSDIQPAEIGILIQIPRSKTDQESHGRGVSISRVQGELCPVAALARWLLVSQTTEGPIFRPVTRGGTVLQSRISPEAIARILKNRVHAIGRDSTRYSGHSLRAGFATAAARVGVPRWRIKAQTGHLSDSILERYIREGELSSADAFQMISASVIGPLPDASQDVEPSNSR